MWSFEQRKAQIANGGGRFPNGSTTGEKRLVVREFETDFKDALYNVDHPDHRLRIAERNELYGMVYGNDPVDPAA